MAEYVGTLYGREEMVLASNGSSILGIDRHTVCESFNGLYWSCAAERYSNVLFYSDVTWTGIHYIAAGVSWYLQTSLTGATWIPVGKMDSYRQRTYASSVAWNGERAVVVGTAGRIDFSPTGVVWTQAQVPDGPMVDFAALAEGNDRLVAVSYDGKIGISFDGLVWQTYPGLVGSSFRDVAFGNGRFVALGGGNGRVAISTDGITWTTSSVGPGHLLAVVWSDSRFYTLMDRYSMGDKAVYSSQDGETWAMEIAREEGGNFYSLASGDGVMVVVGDESYFGGYVPLIGIARSDGEWQWSLLDDYPLAGVGRLYDVSWSGDRWVVVAGSGSVITSTDLEHWELADPGVSGALKTVRWNGDEILAAGSAGVVSSVDGLIWQQESLPTSSTISDLIWYDDAWLAVGSFGMVLQGACDPKLEPPLAGFTVSTPSLVVNAPIRFADASQGHLRTWQWSFGDGGTSSAASPLHIYSAPGTFEVAQTVCSEVGCDTVSSQLIITDSPPVADFITEKVTIKAGEPELFRDLSAGLPIEWEWRFGDGSLSREQNPIHTFGEPGIYHVSLLASNDQGQSQVSEPILVGPAMPLDHNLPGTARPYDLVKGPHLWVVVGRDGFIASSHDCAGWTVHGSGTGSNLRSVTWTGEAFVAVGDGAIVVSESGTDWRTVVQGSSASDLRAVAGSSEAVVAVGGDGLMLRSENLESWDVIDCGTTYDLTDIAANEELFVVVVGETSDSLLESPTGRQWTPAELEGGQALAVAAAPTGFLAVGPYAIYRREVDGSWTSESSTLVSTFGGDLVVTEGGNVAFVTQDKLYWLSPKGVWLPVETASEVIAVEATGTTLYMLMVPRGISTLPIHKRFASRRGARLH
jgi:PKD repeat protein